MGVSTDGILFYGFYEKEQGDWSDDYEDEEYIEQHGQTMFADRFEELYRTSNLYLGTHCSNNYPLRFLAIKSSLIEASRGHPESIDPRQMIVQSEWNSLLRTCLAEMSIDVGKQEPGWYLASYWG